MKIVIDIPEEEYELVQHGNKSYTTELVLMNAVAEGIPLPKGHGDLIDRSLLEVREFCGNDYFEYVSKDDIEDAPTIIEGSDSEWTQDRRRKN